MKNNLLDTLNPSQKEAVLHIHSPLLIIAGAGSGKTRVITHKIAYLLQEKEHTPAQILGVTFTNKAAGEMKNRIHELTGIDAHAFNISTFHALGMRILRESGHSVGFDRDWQIMDEGDHRKIIERIVKDNSSHFTSDMRDAIKRKISLAKMELIYPNNRELLLQRNFNEEETEIYSLYFKFQKQNKMWDYEDLISLPVKMLHNNRELTEKYSLRYRYVMVDEFQDTNPNQYELIRLIAGEHKNITIVGDDDQAIYSWRGASIRFLSNFEHDFPNTHIIKLQQNYRSTPQVIDFANDMITKNRLRRPKTMWTDQEKGAPVHVIATRSKEDEAEAAADFINRLKKEKPELFPLAILYRINSQSLSFETEFAKQGVPFKILKGLRFFERKEIKDTLALLRIGLNLMDDVSFLRMVDFLPLGIGAKTLHLLSQQASDNNISMFHALSKFHPDKYRSKSIFGIILDTNKRQSDYTVSQILEMLLRKSGYMELLEGKNEEERILNIRELQDFIKKWEAEYPNEIFADLLDRINLDSDLEQEKNENDGDEPDKQETRVFLLTMHNAKGLEFPTVIVAGVNSTFMPFFLRKERSEIEEERRLLYVAATRAEKQLLISTGGDKPSAFLDQISPQLFKRISSIHDIFPDNKKHLKENSSLLPDATPLRDPSSPFDNPRGIPEIPKKNLEDKFLEHPLFGKGKILNIIGQDKYLVLFDKKGEKVIDASVVPVTLL